MVCVDQILRRNSFEQLHFHRQWGLAGRQPRAIADTEDVRIDRHRRFTKGNIQHHVGSFAPNARQSLERRSISGHHTAVLLHQYLAGLHQMFGLASIQTNGLDVAQESFDTQIQDRLGRVSDREEPACCLVDPDVRRLSRQQNRRQKFEHTRILELGVGLGIR